MENKTTVLIRRVFGIVLSVSLILAGICFIAGCLSIYYSGDKPYSRQAVADTFSKIAVPVYLCIALTVIGFVLEFILPLAENNKRTAKVPAMIRKALLAKKNVDGADVKITDAINKEEKGRRIHVLIRTLLLVIGSVVFLIFALDPGNFHTSDINSSMTRAMWVLIPCLAVPFAYSVFTAYYCNKSIVREIELIKQLPAAKDKTQAKESSVSVNVVRIVILCIGVAILVWGFISGGTADVLTKAVNICTECIGLG